jgi:hypothetical protein
MAGGKKKGAAKKAHKKATHRKASTKARAKSSAVPGTIVGHVSYAGKRKVCYGKKRKVKGGGLAGAVYCRNEV